MCKILLLRCCSGWLRDNYSKMKVSCFNKAHFEPEKGTHRAYNLGKRPFNIEEEEQMSHDSNDEEILLDVDQEEDELY